MKTKKIMAAYLVSSIVLGVGLAVWRILLMMEHYDFFNNEYSLDAKSGLQALAYAVFAAVLLMATSYLFLKKQSFREFSASSNQVSVFSSSLLGFVFAACATLIMIYYSTPLFETKLHTVFKMLQIVSWVLLFISAVYFIFSASVRNHGLRFNKILAFAPALWGLTFLITSYLNPAYNYSDFNHNLCNVSIAALLLFFLFEARTSAYGTSTALRFTVSLIAMVCILVYMLPLFVLMAFWELSAGIETIFEAVECGAIFYIFAVLYTMIDSLEEKKPTSLS